MMAFADLLLVISAQYLYVLTTTKSISFLPDRPYLSRSYPQ